MAPLFLSLPLFHCLYHCLSLSLSLSLSICPCLSPSESPSPSPSLPPSLPPSPSPYLSITPTRCSRRVRTTCPLKTVHTTVTSPTSASCSYPTFRNPFPRPQGCCGRGECSERRCGGTARSPRFLRSNPRCETCVYYDPTQGAKLVFHFF